MSRIGIAISWVASAAAILLLAWAGYIIYDTKGDEIGIGPAAVRVTGAAVIWVFGQGIRRLCGRLMTLQSHDE